MSKACSLSTHFFPQACLAAFTRARLPAPQEMKHYTTALRNAVHNTFRNGEGTRDLSGPSGLTTEAFVDKVRAQQREEVVTKGGPALCPPLKGRRWKDPP